MKHWVEIRLKFILHYITLTNYLLYCKGDIQITSGHSTINMERKTIDF